MSNEALCRSQDIGMEIGYVFCNMQWYLRAPNMAGIDKNLIIFHSYENIHVDPSFDSLTSICDEGSQFMFWPHLQLENEIGIAF